jgi:DNA-binding beta-propeller fold protein YncE
VKTKAAKIFLIFAPVVMFLVMFTQVQAGEVYVGATTLYFIDDVENKVTASLPLKRFVNNINVSKDGSKAYVGTSGGVHIIDIKTRAVEGLLTDKPGFTVELDDVNGRIYVLTNDRKVLPDGTAEALPSKVLVFDAKTRDLLKTIDMNRMVFDIEVVPEQDRLYCLDVLDAELKIVGLSTGAHVETIYLGDYGIIFKDQVHGSLWRMKRMPDGTSIYIPQGGDQAGILVVATATNSVKRIALDHGATKWRGAVLSPDGKRLYLSAVKNMSVIDLEREEEIAWKTLDVPYQGIALDRSGEKLYLVNPIYDEGGSVAIFDTRTLEPIKRIRVPGASPFTIAVSP